MSTDIYDLAIYFQYDEYLGIYDLHPDNKLVMNLKNLPSNETIVVENNLLDKISYDIYNTEKLWWVLAIYNDIIDPLTNDGKLSINAPSLNDINTLLVRYKSGSL